MPYFTIHKTFLVDSFELDEKERAYLDNYLDILEESGIGEIIESAIKTDYSKGGRPSYNPYKLFSAIAYSFSKSPGSLRDIEDLMKYDLRLIYLMDQEMPSYATISRFCNNVVVTFYKEIYARIVKTFITKFGINIDDCFLDGTKFEANANKYKFVWKPTAFKKNLNDKILALLKEYFEIDDRYKFTSKDVANYISKLMDFIIEKQGIIHATGKGRRPTKLDKDYYKLNDYLLKLLEYEEKEETCGPDRNSYYKTDKDATAMCLKEDYYSGLGSNMHAGYNVQLIVAKGIILDFYVSQERTDFYAFIPAIDSFFNNFGHYPKNICADAGYGSYLNYKYLNEHNIGNFVKYSLWRKQAKGESFELVNFNEDGVLVCLNNKPLISYTGDSINKRHIKSRGNKFYIIDNCRRCKFKKICRAALKNKKDQFRIFELNLEMLIYRRQARDNLITPKGIEMRVNRSSQVEGAFGVIKQDMKFERFKRRGLENVSMEMMFVCLGYIIRKMFSCFKGTAKFDYWVAPKDLVAESFPDPKTAKNKSPKNKTKGKNKTLRSSYKYKRKKHNNVL